MSGFLSSGIVNADTIPDADLLHSRWSPKDISATDGDRITSFNDSVGSNNFDSGDGMDYVSSGINGQPSLNGDGSSDELVVSSWDTTISQPLTIASVGKLDTTARGSLEVLHNGEDVAGSSVAVAYDDSGSFLQFSGSAVNGGASDTNPHITIAVYNGVNSEFYIDNGSSPTATGDAGSRNMPSGSSFKIANNSSGNNFDGLIGEVLFYDGVPDISDVYNYLFDTWGPV
jgi:hypothetical protein